MTVLEKTILQDCKRAGEIIRGNLSKILKDNADTQFGKDHSFSQICDMDAYRRMVPLSDYERFRPYVQSMREGKPNVLTAYPLAGFCRTSGTEGDAKYIPVTREALEHYGNGFQLYGDRIYREAKGKRLFINTFRTDVRGPSEPVLLYSEIYYRYLYEEGALRPEDYAGGRPLLFQREPGDRLYAKVWAAILEEDLTVLESIFLYDVLIFFHYLEKNWREVIEDIRNKRIPARYDLPKETIVCLLSMPVREMRLCQVERECEKGFGEIAQRLWKNLRLVSGISTAAYYAEDEALKRYIGDIPKYYLCYCASECYMGTPVAENDFGYVLLPRNAFYEFLPVDEAEKEETRLIHELEAGRSYEMVITNYSGLYRYRMGDVVKVRGFCGESPVLEFVLRRHQALNLAGEKVSTYQIEKAVRKLGEQGIRLQEYCFGVSAREVPGRYLAAVTLAGDPAQADACQIASCLDEALQRENLDYQDLRRMDAIGRLYVQVFDRDAYRRVLKAGGLLQGHHKPRHIAGGGLSREIFEAAKKGVD